MHGRVLRSPPLLLGALSIALASCVGTSRPARFYTLAPADVRPAAATAAEVTLAVGPVEIPDYVDRGPIVTRAGANGVVVADFDRWAGSLQDEVTRTVVAVLSDRLSSRKIAVSGSTSASVVPTPSTYRAAVAISRFDGTLGESVVLRGRWVLVPERGAGEARPATVTETSITERIDGAGYDALVAAMARALVRFGEEMADSVATTAQVARGS